MGGTSPLHDPAARAGRQCVFLAVAAIGRSSARGAADGLTCVMVSLGQ
jgi:hypothetical protein